MVPDYRVAAAPQPRSTDFPRALRSAITASGLGLERIQYRLGQRGVAVTVTSLSYWQSGRRRPERPQSITAVRHLEHLLGMMPGSLIGLLGPPRPRGRRPGPTRSVPLAKLWPNAQVLLAGMRGATDPGARVISLHDRLEVAADRGQRRLRVRQVVRAERDDVDRWVSVYDVEHPGQPVPRIVPVRSCRPGRVAQDPAAGVLATELLFDRPLDRDETLVLEFEVVHSGPPYPRSGDTFARALRQPVRQYIAEVQFDPGALPAFCWQHESEPDGTNPTRPSEVCVAPSGHAHAVKLDIGPRSCRLTWGWPDRERVSAGSPDRPG